jgi:hypothetical protein
MTFIPMELIVNSLGIEIIAPEYLQLVASGDRNPETGDNLRTFKAALFYLN